MIITVISYFYELFRDNFIVSKLLSGMQAGVGAVIASVVWDMGGGVVKQKSALSNLIMVAAFLSACVLRVNVIYIILACIALGVLRTVLAGRRKDAWISVSASRLAVISSSSSTAGSAAAARAMDSSCHSP